MLPKKVPGSRAGPAGPTGESGAGRLGASRAESAPRAKAGGENQRNAAGMGPLSWEVPGCLHTGSVFLPPLCPQGLIQQHFSGGLKVQVAEQSRASPREPHGLGPGQASVLPRVLFLPPSSFFT